MLKAGILDKGKFISGEEGVPQGSVCSPVLANLFAHIVLDEWFENIVQMHCLGKVAFFRYADDAVICCENHYDTMRIRKVLPKRLAKFKLTLNEEKTHTVRFDRTDRQKSGHFDFLGFTFYQGLSKAGRTIPKVKSSGKKIRVKLSRVNQWCRENRNRYRLNILWLHFCKKLRGHAQYYSVSFNIAAVKGFFNKAIYLFVKWINRRSQRKSQTHKEFRSYMEVYPPPEIKVYHPLF